MNKYPPPHSPRERKRERERERERIMLNREFPNRKKWCLAQLEIMGIRKVLKVIKMKGRERVRA